MPRHFEYLSRAHALNEGLAGSLAPFEPGLAPRTLDGISDGEEWSQLAAQLWAQRSHEEGVSIGVFPSGESEDHGWFAAGLGLFLRQSVDRETLLIDLDSDHAALARALHTPARPGLAEFLNSAPVARMGCVHETGCSGLYVLPQGGASWNFDRRETGERLRWLHSTMQRDFPVVITRFPRMNGNRELRACCGVPEMAVLTVSPGVARKSELRRDTRALRKAGAHLIGLVFTNRIHDRGFRGANQ